MGELRIKYFSQPDLAAGRQLFKVQTLFEHLDENNILCDINDAIELYNAKRWIDSGDSLPTWSDSQKDNYKTIVKTIIPRQLGVFCSKINDDNVLGFINNLSSQYYNDFWSLFVTYKVYNRISPEKFETILTLEKVHLRIILKYKEIVINYDREIANKLKSSYKYATLLVSNYLEYHDERWQPLYFPTTLSNSDKTKLIDDYINSEDPNPNIIELISLSQSSNDLPLSDFTLYAAKKKHEGLTMQFFEKTEGIKLPLEVIFTDETEYMSVDYINNGISGKYSLSWLAENLDYPTILNNFIYLFQFTDSQFRCTFMGGKRENDIFEQLFGIRGKKGYPTDIVYKQFDTFFLMLTQQYEMFLRKEGISLLEVLKWFFESYLADEFATVGFELDIPSKDTTYLEKCKLLATSGERILKQFKMLIENGNIDHELLSISSNPIFYKDIPSFVNDKYIYRVERELDYVFNSMFSNQSVLLIDTEKSDGFDSCYEFMNNVNVKIDEFDMGRQLIGRLINEGYIIADSNGYLKPVPKKLLLIKDLFDNKVSCYHYLKSCENEIKDLKDNNKIQFGSTLFSIPEQQYLNYLFNKSEFSNGLDLRNKYVHGSHAPASAEGEHRRNYYIFLRTLIFISIKINEEFCLKEELNN